MGAPLLQPVATHDPATPQGYVTDVPYLRTFIASIAPAILDHVALLASFDPPSREQPFTYCELGCGQGVTTALLAATHPHDTFHGIDFMPEHIAHAQRFCSDAKISNATFHHKDFRSAASMGLPQFDYIVCHGVYTWVTAEVQQDLRNFIAAHLKPGGLAYVSYNAMPGWATDMPFQHLLRAIGRISPGDNAARATAGLEIIRTMAAAKVPPLVESVMLKEMEKHPAKYAPSYLAHEYMNADWRPLFVTEVRDAMTAIGLIPVGSATLMANFDSFVLGAKARELVASIADPNVRELVRDYYTNAYFRRDVFTRGAQRLVPEEQRRRMLASTFSLGRPLEKVSYTKRTPAGTLSFDNDSARALVNAVAAGPRRLGDVVRELNLDEQDAVANALALCAATILLPVENLSVSVTGLNRVLFSRLEGPEPIAAVTLPSGTAIQLDLEMMKGLLVSDESANTTPQTSAVPEKTENAATVDGTAAWRSFLRSQGAI
jgi:SAM-dependent methyltransferase